MLMAQPGAPFNSLGQRLDGFILSKDQHFQTVARFQRVAIAAGDALLRIRAMRATTDSISATLTVFLRLLTGIKRARARFVNDVNRLIRQMTIVNVFHRQFNRRTHRFGGITHIMVRFVLRLQAVDNLDRLFHRRFGNIDLLETAGQRTIFSKMLLNSGKWWSRSPGSCRWKAAV